MPAYSSLAGFLAANPGWADQATAGINAAPGILNDGLVTIWSLGAGADADYMLIGWTGPYTNYDAAYAGDVANPNSSFLGMSAIATTQTGDPTFTPPLLPVSLFHTFQGMTLAPAVDPEPTFILLASLGTVLLLLFRWHS